MNAGDRTTRRRTPAETRAIFEAEVERLENTPAVRRLDLHRRIRWSFEAEMEQTASGFRVVDRGWSPLCRFMITWGQIALMIAIGGLAILLGAASVRGVVGILGGPLVVGGQFALTLIPLIAALGWGIWRSKSERSVEVDARTGRATVCLPGGREVFVESGRVFLTPGLLTIVGGGAIGMYGVLVLRAGEHRFRMLPTCEEDLTLQVPSYFW